MNSLNESKVITSTFESVGNDIDISEETDIDVSEGNFVAYDKSGRLVHVDAAEFHIDYLCPICRECIMRLKHKPGSEELIFAKKKYQIHTLPDCYETEKKGKIATPHATDFIDFINRLSHVATAHKKGDTIDGGEKKDNGEDPTVTPQKDNETHQLTEVSFSTLKQLQPYLINAQEKNPELIPYIWNYSWINYDLINNFKSGSKIIEARFVTMANNRLLLSIFFGGQSIRIDICFSDKKIYQKIEKRIKGLKSKNDSYDENGAFIAAKINIMIASNRWIYCSNNECTKTICNSSKYCSNCCGYYRTVIVKEKQLYAYIAKDNEH